MLGVPTHSKQAGIKNRAIEANHHPKALVILLPWYSKKMVHLNFISPQAFVEMEKL